MVRPPWLGRRVIRRVLLVAGLLFAMMATVRMTLVAMSHLNNTDADTNRDNDDGPRRILSPNTNIDSNNNHANKQQQRVITLVHVGKAGGMSLRLVTSIACYEQHRDNPRTLRACRRKFFGQDGPLAQQLHYVVHWKGTALEAGTTSLLFTLRNPIDRIVSTFRYSHPLNCFNSTASPKPWGCIVDQRQPWKNQPQHPSYRFYQTCFPSPAAGVEALAQSVKSPWNSTSSIFISLRPSQQYRCRQLARTLVQGKGPLPPAPHMTYNYAYYVQRTVGIVLGTNGALIPAPTMDNTTSIISNNTHRVPYEIMVVRTEQQWHDMIDLDRQLGGSGTFLLRQPTSDLTKDAKNHESHGSEYYQPISPPLSTTGYRKLCCVLHDELGLYQYLLQQATNISPDDKYMTIMELYTKCGVISVDSPSLPEEQEDNEYLESVFGVWLHECQKQLVEDQILLTQKLARPRRSRAITKKNAATHSS